MGLRDLAPGAQIGLGITVGILSTSVQSLGLTLQRQSHLLEDDRPEHDIKRPPHRRRRWQIGMLLFIVSNLLGSSIQITTLPLVILSPLQASGLVFNSMCATLILAEPFTRYSLVGTVLVCVGAALIAAFGALKEPAHTLDELLMLLSKTPFLLWMAGTAVLVTAVLGGARASQVMFPRTKHTAKMRMGRGIAYGCVSGILSAHCLLLAKSAVELLVRTIVDRVNQFNRWQSWMILLGLVSLALTQLYYLHRGLKLCSTSILYPLVFCVYNIIAILDGLIYYRQTSRLSALHGSLIAVGTLILLSGVLALSWRLHDETKPVKAGSALTPGLGYIDIDSEASDNECAVDSDDVPPTTPPPRRKTDEDKAIAKTRHRRRTLSEAQEIWGELEDQDSAPSARRARQGNDGEEVSESTCLQGKHPARRKTLRRGSASYGSPRVSFGTLPPQQAAIGGWWKVTWWRQKGKQTGHDDDMA